MKSITVLIDQIVSILASCGLAGGFVLIILESIFPILSLGVFIGLNMLAFGNVPGILISYVATICGCMMSFCLFKYVIKDKFRKLFKKKKTLKKIDEWLDKLSNIKFTTLTVIIAFPPTPAFLVNIAAGISGYDLKKYLIALIIGKPAMIIFYGYIAVSFVDSLKDPTKFIYVILLIFATYVFSKILEKVGKLEK